MYNRQCRPTAAAKRSPGKLATGLGAHGFEHNVMEIYAGKKTYGMNVLKETAVARSLSKESPEMSPCARELGLLQKQQNKNLKLPGVMVRTRSRQAGRTGRSRRGVRISTRG